MVKDHTFALFYFWTLPSGDLLITPLILCKICVTLDLELYNKSCGAEHKALILDLLSL